MHRYLLHNGRIAEASDHRLVSPGQVGLLNGWGVFSTLRVKNGVLFAYERHFARMRRDAERLRVPFYSDPADLQAELLRLVAANGAHDSTLRVAVVRNQGGIWEAPGIERPFDTVAFTAPLNDWGAAVKLGLVPQGRHAASRFAGTKVLSWAFNLTMYEEAHAKGFDEVVLLNERGEVSECTSANLFLSRGDTVLTPPLHSGCLPGITRQLLLEQVRVPGIRVEEQDLLPSDLEAADEVFITSTTRDLLPVASIESLAIRQEGTARARLQEAFTRYQDEYTRQAQLAAAR